MGCSLQWLPTSRFHCCQWDDMPVILSLNEKQASPPSKKDISHFVQLKLLLTDASPGACHKGTYDLSPPLPSVPRLNNRTLDYFWVEWDFADLWSFSWSFIPGHILKYKTGKFNSELQRCSSEWWKWKQSS